METAQSFRNPARVAVIGGALALVGCGVEAAGDGPIRSTNPVAPPATSPGPQVAAGGEPLAGIGPAGDWGDGVAGATPQQLDAYRWVNYIRHQAGLPFVELSVELNRASVDHAQFIIDHYTVYEAGLSLHEQQPGLAGFTGAKYWERQSAAGYPGPALSEVISYQPLAVSSVWQWVDSVYHRLPLTHPEAARVGYGSATGPKTTVSVMEISKLDTPAVSGPVAFPPDGAVDVPVEWDGAEIPKPPTPPTGYPSGPVFTLQFPGEGVLSVSGHRLREDGGAEIPHMFLEPGNDPHLFGAPVVVVYANDPLKPGQRYWVEIDGHYEGASFSWVSSFETEAQVGCDMLAQDCRPGQGCFALGDERVCAWAGPHPVGGACYFQNDCGPGATCVQGSCRALCDAAHREGPRGCDVACHDGFALLSAAGDVGACNPAPCTPLFADCAGGACHADGAMACGPVGAGSSGAACAASSECGPGLGCVLLGGSNQCAPLCDATPLAAEANSPHGDVAALPACTTACPAGAVSHPFAPDVGVCSGL